MAQCKNGHDLVVAKNGKRKICPECRNQYTHEWRLRNLDAERKRVLSWNRENPERAKESTRRWRLQSKYGLTPELLEARLKAQGGCCANPGCGATKPGGKYATWNIDHDHETGEVRGLLCTSCNMALGLLKENFSRILGLAEYLRLWSEPNKVSS